MSKSKEEFALMSLYDKLQYLSNYIIELNKYVKIDINSLSETDLNYLYDLANQNYQSNESIIKILKNINDSVLYLNNNLNNEIEKYDESTKEAIQETFNNIVVSSINKATEELKNDIHKKPILLNGTFTKCACIVLESILKFEKAVDAIVPGGSDKLIKACFNGIVGLIGASFPIIAITIKASGLVEKMSNFFSANELTKTVESLKNYQTVLENNAKLLPIYENAIKVNKVAQISGVSIQNIQNLNINDKSLDKIINVIEKDKKAKHYLADLAILNSKIPTTQEAAEQISKSIVNNLQEILSEHIQKNDTLNNYKKDFNNAIEFLSTEINKLPSNSNNVFDRICYMQNTISQFNNKLNSIQHNSNINDNIFSAISQKIQDKIPVNDHKLISEILKNQNINKNLNISKANEVTLQKHSQQNKILQR